ncbi:HNH endonuclease [Flavobacterium bizetiae]|uniref:HNH endonuclease n=1 Tax=Flavobacterium bizetiae TaxID=2704140 RepID=UPI0037580163
MIQLTNKDYNTIPEPLTKAGTYRQISRAVLATNGEFYNTTYYKDLAVVNKLKAFSVHRNILEPGDKPKCYYCESHVEHVAVLQVEHFRPKAKVDSIDNNNLPHRGYYWLGLEWSNLLLSCPNCNGKNAKGNRFPLEDFNNRVTAINPIISVPQLPLVYDRTSCIANHAPLINERPLLLNPEYEDPTPHLTFDEFGQIYGVGNKGEKSVEIYTLDRDPLVAARQEKLNAIIRDINLACAARDRNAIDNNSLIIWFETTCTKILELDDIRKEYCLWGRYIIANFENCVVSKIDEYKTELRLAFQNVNI